MSFVNVLLPQNKSKVKYMQQIATKQNIKNLDKYMRRKYTRYILIFWKVQPRFSHDFS